MRNRRKAALQIHCISTINLWLLSLFDNNAVTPYEDLIYENDLVCNEATVPMVRISLCVTLCHFLSRKLTTYVYSMGCDVLFDVWYKDSFSEIRKKLEEGSGSLQFFGNIVSIRPLGSPLTQQQHFNQKQCINEA